MPTREQLESALINADKAGDHAAAKAIANELRAMPEQQTAPVEQEVFNQDIRPQSAQTENVAAPVAIQSNQVAPPIDLKGAIQDRIKQKSLMQRVEEVVSDLPRAGGVTARNILEGVGQTVDFLGVPLRVGMMAAGTEDPGGGGKMLADYLDLPLPANPTERIVSEIEKVLVGGGGMLGLAGKGVQAASGTTQNVMKALAARPELQASSMIGAGAAGGYVKEEGGGPWEQLVAALAGGLTAPAAVSGTQKLSSLSKNVINAMKKSPAIDIKINTVIDSALQSKGIPAKSISASVRSQLNKDMKAALDTGDISPDAVNRLVDYRLTGATPTAGSISLDPGIITKQQNLMKMGAASKDPALQKLSQVANENQKKLIENLNNMGAGTVDDQIATAEKVMLSLDKVAKTAKGKIDPLYKKARDTVGRSAHLDPRKFTQRANDLLDEKLVGGKLPSDVRNKINSIAKGETPLTVDVSEQLKTNMAKLQRTSRDGQEKLSLGLVRQALEETPLLGGQGKAALEAFNTARKTNAAWMKIVEKTPALKAVMDGVEPDKFMNTFIIGQGKGASLKSLANLKKAIKDDAGAQSVIKNYMARFIKEKALGGASDEVGRFSQSNYNKTLSAIGDRKLKMFFTKDEISMLKAVGRVASYEQAQPAGSAVNNSNTASAAISGMLDWLGSVTLLRRVPFGSQLIGDPAKSISQNIQAEQVLSAAKAAATPKLVPPKQGAGIAPFAGAVLSAEGSNNNR